MAEEKERKVESEDDDDEFRGHFPDAYDVITDSRIRKPVIASDGGIYDQKYFESWLKRCEIEAENKQAQHPDDKIAPIYLSPRNNEPLDSKHFTPIPAFKNLIGQAITYFQTTTLTTKKQEARIKKSEEQIQASHLEIKKEKHLYTELESSYRELGARIKEKEAEIQASQSEINEEKRRNIALESRYRELEKSYYQWKWFGLITTGIAALGMITFSLAKFWSNQTPSDSLEPSPQVGDSTELISVGRSIASIASEAAKDILPLLGSAIVAQLEQQQVLPIVPAAQEAEAPIAPAAQEVPAPTVPAIQEVQTEVAPKQKAGAQQDAQKANHDTYKYLNHQIQLLVDNSKGAFQSKCANLEIFFDRLQFHEVSKLASELASGQCTDVERKKLRSIQQHAERLHASSYTPQSVYSLKFYGPKMPVTKNAGHSSKNNHSPRP